MKKVLSNSLLFLIVLLTGIALAVVDAAADQQGQLTLTQDGVNLGFTLTTFATLDPNLTGCCGGPFGVAIAAPDRVLVFNNGNGTRYVFHDVDGQDRTTAITSTTQAPSGTLAYATAGGVAYGGIQTGQFAQYNADGTVNHYLTGVRESTYLGMWGNPINGHLLATTNQGHIIDIDPLANGGMGSYRDVVS
jgi:hypothetical protein